MQTTTKTCPTCGSHFTQLGRYRTYCSITCRRSIYKSGQVAPKPPRACVWCQRQFRPQRQAQFCGKRCRNAAYYAWYVAPACSR